MMDEVHFCDHCDAITKPPNEAYADSLCPTCDKLRRKRVTCRKCGKLVLALCVHTCDRTEYDNGVNDAIAVVQKLSDEWTGCTLDDVYDDAIALIREAQETNDGKSYTEARGREVSQIHVPRRRQGHCIFLLRALALVSAHPPPTLRFRDLHV